MIAMIESRNIRRAHYETKQEGNSRREMSVGEPDCLIKVRTIDFAQQPSDSHRLTRVEHVIDCFC